MICITIAYNNSMDCQIRFCKKCAWCWFVRVLFKHTWVADAGVIGFGQRFEFVCQSSTVCENYHGTPDVRLGTVLQYLSHLTTHEHTHTHINHVLIQ